METEAGREVGKGGSGVEDDWVGEVDWGLGEGGGEEEGGGGR